MLLFWLRDRCYTYSQNRSGLVDMNRIKVTQENWDYLMILDACRYDYFEQVYRDYFQGELTKRISAGTSTNEWRNNSFPGNYDDIVYISANPMFSSTLDVYGYTAGEHFHKVYELWKNGWDKDHGTVLPQTVTQASINIIGNNPNKRFIIHYLQPHEPYLMPEVNSRGHNQGDMNNRALLDYPKDYRFAGIKEWLLKKLLKHLKNNRIITNCPEWFLRQMLGMPPRYAMDAVRRKYGKTMLRKAYRKNLRYVLEQTAILLKYLSGRIIITSDHGELLGEKRCYAHQPNSANPILTEIPWLVIQKSEAEEIIPDDEGQKLIAKLERPGDRRDIKKEQKELKEKLKALGYFE